MAAPVDSLKLEDLDGALASLTQLKAPGASKAKIQAITQVCLENMNVSASTVALYATAVPVYFPPIRVVVWRSATTPAIVEPILQFHHGYQVLTQYSTG